MVDWVPVAVNWETGTTGGHFLIISGRAAGENVLSTICETKENRKREKEGGTIIAVGNCFGDHPAR